MRKLHLLLIFFVYLFCSCNNDTKIDVPTISFVDMVGSAYMADSVPFTVTVNADYPMNSIRIQFYSSGEMVSERIIAINTAGTYGGKLFVPFVKDMNDGTSEVKIIAKNKNFDYSTQTVTLNISRPKFPYLTLKTAYGTFRMEPVSGKSYEYAVDYAFPVQEFNGIIEAPAYGENGNSFYFGGTAIKANALSTDSILFITDQPVGTEYTVSFDVRSYDVQPFVKPSFDGVEFPGFADNLAIIEKNFSQNQSILIRGFLDIDNWWIDPTFLITNADGTYRFRAMDGKYRVTADQNLKFFRIEPMRGNGLADFDPVTKTGGIWVNGGIGDQAGTAPVERLGIPSITANPCLWDPAKNFAMAPMGNGIYQVKLIANVTLFLSNVSASTVGISFYQNSRSMDNALSLDLVETLYGSPGSPDSGAGTPRFMFNNGNSSSRGNMIVSGSNRTLGNGRTYVFTLDANDSPAKISITLE